MQSRITIGNKIIRQGVPAFVIAEAGVNHNGRLNVALKLVDEAARAGADAVKFQTFRAEDLTAKSGKMAAYQIKNTGKAESQFAMLKRLEMPEFYYKPIIKRCKQNNIIFLSTPHGGFSAVQFLRKLCVPAYKFGSGDLNNFPVLQHAARLGKPMILGTGMATMPEVKDAIQCIKKTGNKKIIVLHCTTNYPCPDNEVNLSVMESMINELGVLVGYSDHSLGAQVSIMAATLGACVIEKHFTLDRHMQGPDHFASMEPAEFAEMVASIKRIKNILGSRVKGLNKSEEAIRRDVRKSIVALKDIRHGEKFTQKNVGIKRPGTGLSPSEYKKVIGHFAKRAIAADTLLQKEDYV